MMVLKEALLNLKNLCKWSEFKFVDCNKLCPLASKFIGNFKL